MQCFFRLVPAVAPCGVGCYVLGRAQERRLAKAEDDGSPGVADLLHVCALEQRELPHQIKTWSQTGHF